MTDSEKLDLLLAEMQGMKTQMQSMKTEMQDMKTETQSMKTEMQGMKTQMQSMKTEMQGMKTEIQGIRSDLRDLEHRTINIELHLENTTDKNIQLLAENFIELSNKLNQAIPAADKNLAYEVKVNYLLEEVDKLKKRSRKRKQNNVATTV